MILEVAPQGPVMVTWANFHYLDFVLNWLAHVNALGIKPLVGAMDDKILQVSIPSILVHRMHLALSLTAHVIVCMQCRPQKVEQMLTPDFLSHRR